jgi:hypothetical protein
VVGGRIEVDASNELICGITTGLKEFLTFQPERNRTPTPLLTPIQSKWQPNMDAWEQIG